MGEWDDIGTHDLFDLGSALDALKRAVDEQPMSACSVVSFPWSRGLRDFDHAGSRPIAALARRTFSRACSRARLAPARSTARTYSGSATSSL